MASPGATYAYDALGNRVSRTQAHGPGTADDVVTTYAHDHRNRLSAGTLVAPLVTSAAAGSEALCP
jgi:YD repeat-containing protein